MLNNKALRVCMCEVHYNIFSSEHTECIKMLELIHRSYFWPQMRNFVTHYIRNCHTCSQSKSWRHVKYSILKLLSVLTQWWKDISMNFVINLSTSEGYDAVLMMIDWLTKMRHFIPMHTTAITETVADLYVNHIYCLHEFSNMIVSDWGPQFAALFWKLLC